VTRGAAIPERRRRPEHEALRRPVSVLPGRPFPLGACVADGGVNFCVFSRKAEAVELLLFDDARADAPSRAIRLEGPTHRTYHYWHAFVPGLRAGQLYAYRAFGPWEPARGLRFDPAKVLLDPYARAVVVPDAYDRSAASGPGDTTTSRCAAWSSTRASTTGKATRRSAGRSRPR
jgi:glycogen operon protein